MPIPDNPQTRQEMYLNAMATGDSSGIPESPQTREEMYLDAIVKNGSGGGGGGGGGGGFTLLHGTYSVVDNAEIVTLPITASALYALMQTSCVAFDYTSNDDGYSISGVASFTEAKLTQEEGYADQYLLVAAEYSGWFGATDAVVITLSGGK